MMMVMTVVVMTSMAVTGVLIVIVSVGLAQLAAPG
jgi:hypothetical protein